LPIAVMPSPAMAVCPLMLSIQLQSFDEAFPHHTQARGKISTTRRRARWSWFGGVDGMALYYASDRRLL
jgi:hypothetical protein